MIEKEFDAITKDDIDVLVTNGVSEGRTLEYKEQLPGRSEDDTREFLADASSLANSGGGDIIYGIREQRDSDGKATGSPQSAEGLAGANADQEERRLENMLRDGIDPRIPGVRVKHFEGFPAGPVLMLRLPKSWLGPHMVKYKNRSRFFSRTSAGKHQLDVREIRAAFLASEAVGGRIGAFRSERVGKILTGEGSAPLGASPKMVLHVLPIRSFSEPVSVDLKAAEQAWGKSIKPMGQLDRWGPARYNFHGLYSPGSFGPNAGDSSYVQLFRNGAMEAACLWMYESHLLNGAGFEQDILRAAPQFLEFLESLDFGPPAFVCVSAISVKGFVVMPVLNPAPFGWHHSAAPSHEDVLMAPEVLTEAKGTEIKRLLRPALDTIWQASGWPGSPGYGADGKWAGFARFLGAGVT